MPNVRPFVAPRSRFSRPLAFVLGLISFLLAGQPVQAQTAASNTIQFAKSPVTVMMSERTVQVMVVRTVDIGGRVQAEVDVTPNAGTNFVDLAAFTSRTVVFSNFQTSATISVPLKDPTTTNQNGTFSLILTNLTVPSGEDQRFTPVLGSIRTMNVDVVDDDDPFTFYFTSLNPTVQEGNTLNLEVFLAKSPSASGSMDTVSVNYAVVAAGGTDLHPGSEAASLTGTAQIPADVVVANGTLTFGPGDTRQTISIDTNPDQQIEFNEDFKITLSGFQGTGLDPASTNGGTKPYGNSVAASAVATILFNGSAQAPQPPGAVDNTFNPDLTAGGDLLNPGANGQVLAIEPAPGGMAYIGGQFSAYNAVPRPFVARVFTQPSPFDPNLALGSLDPSFSPPSGPDGPVTSLAVYDSGPNAGKVLIGGAFHAVDGISRNGLARLNPDGSLDTTFEVGLGANGTIYSIELEFGGEGAIIGGDFTVYDGTPRGGLARVLADGSVDASYLPGAGANGTVLGLTLQDSASQRLSFSGTSPVLLSTNPITRRIQVPATGGQLLFTYSTYRPTGTGAGVETNGPIGDQFVITFGGQLVLDTDLANTTVLVTNVDNGAVTVVNTAVTIPRTVGPLPGAPNELVIVVNPLGSTNFTEWSYSGQMRLFGPRTVYAVGDFTTVSGVSAPHVVKLTPSGAVDSAFQAQLGTGTEGAIMAVGVQSDGKVILGGSFTDFNSVSHPRLMRLLASGAPDDSFVVGSGPNDRVNSLVVAPDNTIYIAGDFTSYNTTRRLFVARLLPSGVLDTTFLDTAFNQYAGFPHPAGLAPSGNLSAVAVESTGDVLVGGRFGAVGGGSSRASAVRRQNFARLKGGSDTSIAPGAVQFARTTYGVEENTPSVSFELSRISGSVGAVAVTARTIEGSATARQDFTPVTNTVQFANRSTGPLDFGVTIIDENPPVIEGNEDFFVEITRINSLFNLNGEPIPVGAALGPVTFSRGVIIENDRVPAVFSFSKPEYEVDEGGTFATIEVFRTGNLLIDGNVDVIAALATATNAAGSTDFTATSTNLLFLVNQTNSFFRVPVSDDALVESDEVVSISLANASEGSTLNTTRSTATLTIIDNDLPTGKIDFGSTNFVVFEGQTNAVVTVRRTGGNAGFIFLDWETFDDTAVAPGDYLASGGRLTWNDRDVGDRVITIPLVNDTSVEPTERFGLRLKNESQPGIIGSRNPTTFVTITDDDSFGTIEFASTNSLADENGVNARIVVLRKSGSSGTVSVNYATAPDSVAATAAVPGRDYVETNGTLVFGPGETAKFIEIPILDDNLADSNRVVAISLSAPVNGLLGAIKTNKLTILDNELLNIPGGGLERDFAVGPGADGPVNVIVPVNEATSRKIIIAGDFSQYNNQIRSRVARLNDDGTLDALYGNGVVINGVIRSGVVTRDGKFLIGGSFSSVDGSPANFFSRLTSSGRIDTSFNIGSGADNPVFAVAQSVVTGTSNAISRLLIGGDFVTVNSVQRPRIAALNDDGSVDTSFNPGAGANGSVLAIAPQSDGKIVIGGTFTSVSGTPRARLARLNVNGTLDTSFDIAAGFNGAVRVIVVQPDGKILVGGDFQTVNNQPRTRIARLLANGALDTTFTPGTGADGTVNSIALQPDGAIPLGGTFTSFNGVPRNRVTRLLPDGAVDFGINFGTGANGAINSVAIQSDRKILVAGGFTQFDGAARGRVARLFGGSLAGSGAVEFAGSLFTYSETERFATITVRRTGGTVGTNTVMFATVASPEETGATPGSDYFSTNGTLTFGPGEVVKTFQVQLINDAAAEGLEDVGLALTNSVGGSLGRQPVATLQIVSEDSVVGFTSEEFLVNENSQGGRAGVTIFRDGDMESVVIARVSTSNGTATSPQDYEATTQDVVFAPGEREKVVSIVVRTDNLVEGDEDFNVNLSIVSGVATVVDPSSKVIIIDGTSRPGVLQFSGVAEANEGAGFITVTVSRSAGKQGVVTVDYTTANGTARAPSDYTPVSGTLSFQESDEFQTITIPIFEDSLVEGNETIRVTLSNPQNEAVLGPRSTIDAVIVDNDIGPGSVDPTFDTGSGAAGTVYSIVVQPDGKVVAGGEFTSFNNAGHPKIVRLLDTGAIDNSFLSGAGPAGTVFSLAPAPDGKITLAGNFRSFNSIDTLNIARVDTNGVLDTTMTSLAGVNNTIFTLEPQPDTTVLVGGDFTVPQNRIARINASGELDVSFNTGLGADATVLDIGLQADGRVIVGGAFQTIGGVPQGRLARLLANGLLDNTFNPGGAGANGTVRAILPLADGKILVAGNFTQYNGQPRVRVIRLNSDGSLDDTFVRGSGPNNTVLAMAVQSDGKIILGGDFTAVDGEPRTRIARLNANGSLDLTFNPGLGADGAVYDIEILPDGKIMVAGAFTTFNGFRRAGVARLRNEVSVPEDSIQITQTRVLGGTVELTFTSVVGAEYTVYSSEDLENWVIERELDPATSTTTTVVGLPMTTPHRFYLIGSP